jgi:hypothetical protein
MIAMKKLPVENLGFVEIGGVGEMIYRAVRFPEYVPDYDDDGEVLKPVFTGLHAPESGTDYSLNRAGAIGQPMQSLREIK